MVLVKDCKKRKRTLGLGLIVEEKQLIDFSSSSSEKSNFAIKFLRNF